VVLSFYVKNSLAASDLVDWFETGYQFVVDADKSPGEISPNKYLVFVEIKRRSFLLKQMKELVNDLETLTEFTEEEWTVTYNAEEYSLDDPILHDVLILTPLEYRKTHEVALNELRVAANLPVVNIYEPKKNDPELNLIKRRAGLI